MARTFSFKDFKRILKVMFLIFIIIYFFWFVDIIPNLLGPIGWLDQLGLFLIGLVLIVSSIRTMRKRRKQAQTITLNQFIKKPGKLWSMRPRSWQGFGLLIVFIAVAMYVINPADLIPDTQFVIGWIDDIGAGLAFMLAAIKLFKQKK